jgi:dihydroxyacid dehydratase/phosphogluconate dehydratase
MAIGGSTNGVLHLQAIASELDLDIEPETFNQLRKKNTVHLRCSTIRIRRASSV